MSTVSDGLYQYGGQPVGGRRGIWGKTYFVDGDNGGDGKTGKKPSAAFATIGQALSSASIDDVIYIRSRGPATDQTDPANYSENLTVANADAGIALIGTSPSLNPFYTQIKGSSTGPVLTINAPDVLVENLCFNRGSSTTGIIRLQGDNNSSEMAWGVTILNCHIRNANSQANAGIVGEAGSYNTIQDVLFVACHTGIILTSGSTYPLRANQISGCKFVESSGAAVGGSHIIISGVSYDSLITNCHFQGKPTNAHVILAGDGILSNSYFGDDDITPSSGGADVDVAAGWFVSGCYDNSGALLTT